MITELRAVDSALDRVKKVLSLTIESQRDKQRLIEKANDHLVETVKLIRRARELDSNSRKLGSIYSPPHPPSYSPRSIRDDELLSVSVIFTIKRTRKRVESVMGVMEKAKDIAEKKVWTNLLNTENVKEGLKEKEKKLREVRYGVFAKIIGERV